MIYTTLLGHPVDHSVSPILFGALAEGVGLEYAHLKIDVPNKQGLKDALRSLTCLGFSGANVTLPYKLDVIPLCDELDPLAESIGAVNSLVFGGGKIRGYNTDAIGALQAIQSQLRPLVTTDRVAILGAGGAARAIAHALAGQCEEIFIVNTNLVQAQQLVQSLPAIQMAKAKKLTPLRLEWFLSHCNIIINATPVGMYPNLQQRIVPLAVMAKAAKKSDFQEKYFLDAIFNPYKTHFLLDAERLGAKTCSGTYMMIFQAIAAFELWTGIKLEKINVDNLNAKMIKALTIL